MNPKSLEEIKEMSSDLKKVNEQRELNIKDTLDFLNRIRERYNDLSKEEGVMTYCNENCIDIPLQIKDLLKVIGIYRV